MGRIVNKDQFRSVSAELPAKLVAEFKAKTKAEHKNLTQKLRELIERDLAEDKKGQ